MDSNGKGTRKTFSLKVDVRLSRFFGKVCRLFVFLVERHVSISLCWLSLRTISGSVKIAGKCPTEYLQWRWGSFSAIVKQSLFVPIIKAPVSWEASSVLSPIWSSSAASLVWVLLAFGVLSVFKVKLSWPALRTVISLRYFSTVVVEVWLAYCYVWLFCYCYFSKLFLYRSCWSLAGLRMPEILGFVIVILVLMWFLQPWCCLELGQLLGCLMH